MSRSDWPDDDGKTKEHAAGSREAELEAALRRLGDDVLSESVPGSLLDVLNASRRAHGTRRDAIVGDADVERDADQPGSVAPKAWPR